MAVFTRQQWGAAPPKRTLAKDAPGDGMAVHHVGSNLVAPTSVIDAMAVLRNVQGYHLNHPTENYSDIAYSMAVDQLGNIYELRGMDVEAGATYGANDTVRACLWIGDSRVSVPTDAALAAIAVVYQTAVSRGHLVPGSPIRGHRDYSDGTECPGDTLEAMLPKIRQLVTAIDPNTPLDLGPATEDDELNDIEKAQLKAVADVLAPQWPRIGRAATLADVAEMQFDNFTRQAQANAQILAVLQSIDAKLGTPPATTGTPSAAELVDAFIERLGRS